MAYSIIDWTGRMPSSLAHIKATYPMTPIGITVHNTANKAPARNEINYMLSNANYTSYHVAIDDTEAIEAIPFSRNAWHAGKNIA